MNKLRVRMRRTATPPPRGERSGFAPPWVRPQIWDLVAILACLIALWYGWRTTYDLDWPPDFDLYRDISIAQTILDGGGLADPAYLDERLWYNPLVPASVAGISWLTGWSVPVLYARAGAYLNLVAPICFYLSIAYLFKDRLTAFVSTLAFLFITCQCPTSRACASYSPWLFTANFTQAGFYLTLLLYERALRWGRRRDFLFVGLSLGLTFLGHLAPALILGGIIALHTASTALRGLDRTLSSPCLHEATIRLGIVVGTALAVGSPYLSIIVGHYKLHILNPAPGGWIFPELELENVLSLLRANLSLPNLIALAGGVMLWTRPRERLTYLLTLWFLVCSGFIGLDYLSQLASRLGLPTFHTAPSIHFMFYLKALVSALFGYGLLALVRFVLELGKYLLHHPRVHLPNHLQARVERAAMTLLALIMALKGYGPFVNQPAFNEVRVRAQTVIPPGWHHAYTWIRDHTSPADVFLAPPYFGLHIVTPAGRKVVALKPVFSNPFVEATARLEHNSALYDYLQSGDAERFAILASAYDVRYVVAIDNSPVAIYNSPGCRLETAFTDEGVTIYAVSLPPPAYVNLGGKVEFLGSVTSWEADGRPQIELYLRCIEPIEDDYTLWFHADTHRETITFDHTLPTSKWRAGQIIHDTFTLDVPTGRYRLSFGLWMWQDGRRLWRTDNGGAGIDLGEIEVKVRN